MTTVPPEIIRPFQFARRPKVVVFDFDGTLSLLRAGWVELMIDMMLPVLRPLPGSTESDQDLLSFVSEFVHRLTGQATVFQMEYFVNAARQRGGQPQSAEKYTQVFLDALNAKANERIELIGAGKLTAEEMLVPGSVELLADLKGRGVQLTLASGTPGVHVRREAHCLGIDHFFDGRIFGPGDDWRAFSKLDVMRQVLAIANAEGCEFVGVGDGFVETENTKSLGGIAIGCATDELERSGRIEFDKRDRLIHAGADVIVPDYRRWRDLTQLLFAA